MTETPGARDWLGEGADSWTGQLGDNKDQKSLPHYSARHLLIGAALDSGQGWKIRPVFLFTGFVKISVCFFCGDCLGKIPRNSPGVRGGQKEQAVGGHVAITKLVAEAPGHGELGFRHATELVRRSHKTGVAVRAHLTCPTPFFFSFF